MSVLRSIESKLESLFEGVFGRAFRTNVQPVELARKLVKEMDDHRNVSVSRVYVPNEYTIYLAPGDREQFSRYEEQLRDELGDYLAEHARRERYVLLTPPRVELETDDDLDVGVFGIATRMVQPAGRADEGPPTDARRRARRWSTSRGGAGAAADRGSVGGRPRSAARGRRAHLGGKAPGDREAPRRDRPLEGLRHPGRPTRTSRAATPRSGPGRRDVLARRPRLDERRRGTRQARQAAEARGRNALHDRVDGDRLLAGARIECFAVGRRSRRPSSPSRSPSSSCSTSSSGGSSARRHATCGCRRSR